MKLLVKKLLDEIKTCDYNLKSIDSGEIPENKDDPIFKDSYERAIEGVKNTYIRYNTIIDSILVALRENIDNVSNLQIESNPHKVRLHRLTVNPELTSSISDIVFNNEPYTIRQKLTDDYINVSVNDYLGDIIMVHMDNNTAIANMNSAYKAVTTLNGELHMLYSYTMNKISNTEYIKELEDYAVAFEKIAQIYSIMISALSFSIIQLTKFIKILDGSYNYKFTTTDALNNDNTEDDLNESIENLNPSIRHLNEAIDELSIMQSDYIEKYGQPSVKIQRQYDSIQRQILKENSSIILTESKSLSTEERNELDDDEFGLPDDRKFPLNDADHIQDAIRKFGYCKPELKEELANNIKNKVIEMDLVGIVTVGRNHPDASYFPEWMMNDVNVEFERVNSIYNIYINGKKVDYGTIK